ncbi:hypothetical protein SLEP1_g53487 [Rubroshorea leprosula]|uniref:RNase H type-1 domain-containing protein n=1 Tax=Rubroshorea leprosula TaxID=152421 RepID=A0AAV5M9Q4_9ROSI|nr:hypothetical protein SLEP1_g53487 [Rubroshorea leprosula]
MQVHQKERESLRDYMQQFNKATLDIDNVPDTICLSALLHGLKRGRFLDDLLENPPKTWNEVNDRSASFILSEDFQSSKRRADDKQSKSHEQPPRREEKKKQKVNEQWGKPADFPKYANYIPLTSPRSQILAQIQHWIRKPPPPLHDSPRGYDRPQGQRYQLSSTQDVYQDNQYPSKQGKAYRGRQFNRRGQGQRTATQNQKDRKGVGYAGIPLTFGTINMISGGIYSGGQSARGHKAYAFQKMQLNPSALQKYKGPIYKFNNQPVPVEGVITLPIYVGSEQRFRMASVSFLVIKMESAFNAILGRATLYGLKAVISQPHLCMKFPTPQGVGVLRGNQKMARAYYQDTFKKVELAAAPKSSSESCRPTQLGQQTMSISDIEHRPKGVEQKAEPVELVETVPLNPDIPERTIKVGTKLITEERAELLVFNPVLVKKPNGKWRMCIDFTNLNEAYAKDPHPLPNVEKLVERAAGHAGMSFLDANLGYHQVQLLLDNQEKTAFYAGDAIYYYVMIPFGLKNAGATYQKLVQIVFKLQIGRNIEVYVNDMIVTSKRAEDHITDLNETFQNLRRAQMKLNPLKCTFAVESRKFLGYVVSKKGIEVNPEKVQAVQQMEPPKTVKDVQRLTGRVAVLHRFIARLAERCLPFFKVLREPKNFQSTDECQQAFDELKQYLASVPLLSKPVEGESLYLYLGVVEEAKPICYVSKVLQGAEQNYLLAEKATFALVYTARKLRAYFQSHQIIVYTNLPLKKILQKLELSGRLIGWSVELSEYDLKFQPRTTIKGQAVADFLVECLSATVEERAPVYPIWVLYVDGAANIEGSGAGAMLVGPNGFKSKHALRFKFQTTNNAAEYEALIYGLTLAFELKVQNIKVFSDSQLVVGQVNGSCEIRDPQLGRYASVVYKLKSGFASFQIDKIPRVDNQRTDELSKLASSQDINSQRSTFVEVLDAPSYTDFTIECQLLSTDPSSPSWTTLLIEYLQSSELSEDPSTTKLIKCRAAHFTLLDNQLYKRAASMPLLRCLTPYEAEYAVREVHEGVCGTHIGGRTLARKLLRHGYYWPTMVKNA